MNKLEQNVRNRLHFWWFIIAVVCIVLTCYWVNSKATANYEEILKTVSKECSSEVVKLLIEGIEPNLSEIALHYAAKSGCLDIIKFLIVEKKVNIDATDKYAFRRTALHHAADYCHLEVVKFLLEKSANPNITDNDGKRPRKLAVMESRHNKNKHYDEIVKLLANAEDKFQAN